MKSSILKILGMVAAIASVGGLAAGPSAAGELNPAQLYANESLWRGYAGGTFRLCRISSNGAIPATTHLKIRVDFEEDSDRLTDEQIAKLQKFMAELPRNAIQLRLNAHADLCGDADYNQALSHRRGQAVWDVIHRDIPRRLNAQAQILGEQKSKNHARHDRFVEILVEVPNPEPQVKHLVIFDISGSLDRKNTVTQGRTISGATVEALKNIRLAPGTLAYVSRDANYSCQGPDLAAYTPVGEDFYHDAMIVLSHALHGKVATTTTWTDDTDYYRPRGRKALAPIAKEKNLKWQIQ